MVCNPAQSKWCDCDNSTKCDLFYKQKKIDIASVLFVWERSTAFSCSPTANDGGGGKRRQYKHLKHMLVSPILQRALVIRRHKNTSGEQDDDLTKVICI